MVVEHPSKTLTDFPIRGSSLQRWLDNSAIESVMVSLTVIILEVLVDHTSQMLFPLFQHR